MSNPNDNLIGQKRFDTSRVWWQKRTVNIGIALFGLLLVIAIMTVNVAKYETHLATGDTVLLALAPVDPRGFMQGDYMALSYALERDVFNALPSEPDDIDKQEMDAELQPELDTEQVQAAQIRSKQLELGEFESETAAFEATQAEADARFVAESQQFEQNFDSHNPSEGYLIIRLDNNNVGKFVRLADSADTTLANNEMAIHYRVRDNQVKLATNAFFFQEGQAEAFEAAEYGLFRVNKKGEPLLTDMVDSEFKVIEPNVKEARTEEILGSISS